MDELVQLVVKRTGMPEAQAKQAVETIVEFIKQKLPPSLAGQVDAALSNEETIEQAEKLIDEGIGALGGLLGKK